MIYAVAKALGKFYDGINERKKIRQTRTGGGTMKLGLIQTKQNRLYDFGYQGNISKAERKGLAREMVGQTAALLERAAADGCDLLVTPEAINFTGVPLEEETCAAVEPFGGESYWQIARIARQYRTRIVAGLYNRRQNRIYNSAVCFGPGGEVEMVYDKMHLAGEENRCITPGGRYCVYDTPFGTIGLLICWDMQQPGAVRATAALGADLIVCPTWGWENGYAIPAAVKHSVMLAASMGVPYQGRIEGRRSPSEIISRKGRILAAGRRDGADIVTIELSLSKGGRSE